MRKFDCNSFRITGNTSFKKKLTSFVSKSVWENPAMKVKVATEIRRHTAGSGAVVFPPFSERLLFFEKFILKPKCFCTQMKFAYSSVMCPFKLN